MGYPIDGILLVDKIEGETSYEVVKKVKPFFGGARVQKVGHAGTLDPFATGLLIILLGQGTKLSNFIMSGTKVYLAGIRLGIETDTMDHTGRVIGTSMVPDLVPEFIQEACQGFVGDIEQVPPAYSAVKYKGVRAYKLARRGLDVNLKSRIVTVHSLRIIAIDLPDITIEVSCSSGTYIRRLASDFGKKLETGAHLRSLRRLTSGPFEVRDAVGSREISNRNDYPLLREKVIPLGDALPDMREIEVDNVLAEKVQHGYQPTCEDLAKWTCDLGDGYAKLVRDGNLIAVVKVNMSKEVDHGEIKIKRVFS